MYKYTLFLAKKKYILFYIDMNDQVSDTATINGTAWIRYPIAYNYAVDAEYNVTCRSTK